MLFIFDCNNFTNSNVPLIKHFPWMNSTLDLTLQMEAKLHMKAVLEWTFHPSIRVWFFRLGLHGKKKHVATLYSTFVAPIEHTVLILAQLNGESLELPLFFFSKTLHLIYHNFVCNLRNIDFKINCALE